ncbi:hypothetical protein [Pedobacter chitinilyticus]|uniref:Uncharacterized protein n=1 Tax=Pedobacter chitinilyticus TaxID=2233776 RepID=A0A443YVW8_9SPHI|nr:hypothetical protein [Pedobacter chitinilyticus]RWU08125.1 hypothetical protein DPV69_07020 [Pedobacter chitinilyticus]
MSNAEINQENFDYLAKQLAYSGFSEISQQELEKKMLKDKEEFSIEHSAMIGKDKVHVTLNFAKGKNRPELSDKEYYFFNSFDMQLQKEGQENAIKQNFGMYYGNSFSMHEAYNLMDGRSVNKTFISKDKEPYNAWAYIDFKKTTDDGNFQMKRAFNFDLDKALQKLPIKNIEVEKVRENLAANLGRGTIQMVNFVYGDREEKRYIEAAPRYNGINLYDENMKRQFLANENDKKQQTGEQLDQSQRMENGSEAVKSESQPTETEVSAHKQENGENKPGAVVNETSTEVLQVDKMKPEAQTQKQETADTKAVAATPAKQEHKNGQKNDPATKQKVASKKQRSRGRVR